MTQEYTKNALDSNILTKQEDKAAKRNRAGGDFITPKAKKTNGDSMNTLVTTRQAKIDEYDEWIEESYKEWAEMKERAYSIRKKYQKRKQLYPRKTRLTFYG